MTTLDQRITQFENMALADPDNDMAHFSLGNAYFQSERWDDAATSLRRCIELNPDMSKAFQLAGEALLKTGRQDEAITLLERGYDVAIARGDVMPRDAIADLLRSIGREPPAVSRAAEVAAAEIRESGAFVCQRTGRPGTQLPDPPFRGRLGKWIHENISAETWQEWIGQGTKVINELRLDFSREEDQAVYDQHMCEFLGIDQALFEQLTTPA
ncbi:MAG: Fe(2+)-trafficking protein [Planctomycetota bacterium]|jgi:Fe-S cluster biosynthesis and repair protein YggX